MSYIITNGEYYIKYFHKTQTTTDIEEAYIFDSVNTAKEILQTRNLAKRFSNQLKMIGVTLLKLLLILRL